MFYDAPYCVGGFCACHGFVEPAPPATDTTEEDKAVLAAADAYVDAFDALHEVPERPAGYYDLRKAHDGAQTELRIAVAARRAKIKEGNG